MEGGAHSREQNKFSLNDQLEDLPNMGKEASSHWEQCQCWTLTEEISQLDITEEP